MGESDERQHPAGAREALLAGLRRISAFRHEVPHPAFPRRIWIVKQPSPHPVLVIVFLPVVARREALFLIIETSTRDAGAHAALEALGLAPFHAVRTGKH